MVVYRTSFDQGGGIDKNKVYVQCIPLIRSTDKRYFSYRVTFLPAAKPRRSMDGKMSVGGTGVVHFLGIFCEIELKSNSDISN